VKRWLALLDPSGRVPRQAVQRALLILALSVSVAWQWADPQGHLLPQLTHQAQQLEQQISARHTEVQAFAKQRDGAASLQEQTLAWRQRYWRADQTQDWLMDAQRQAMKAGVQLLDWRIAPTQPQGGVSVPGGTDASAVSPPIHVRMQLRGQHAQLIHWFARQVDALPAAQILDWHWQAQGEQGNSTGQLTLLWSLPVGTGPAVQEQGQHGQTSVAASAHTEPRLISAKTGSMQTSALPALAASPDGSETAGSMHHWPDTELSQLRFVGLLAGSGAQPVLALLSHVASTDAVSGQAGKPSVQNVVGSVRIGDRLGVRGVRVVDIDERGVSWRLADAQGTLAPQAP
jgi:hypothetical protein